MHTGWVLILSAAHAATPEDDDPMRMEPPKFTLFLRAPNAEVKPCKKLLGRLAMLAIAYTLQ